MSKAQHIAAIDLGSNSFHLIVARELTGCIQSVLTQKKSVALASGLDENNYLSGEAMQRGLDCLAEFNQLLSGLTCRTVRIVATYSLRVAVNSDEFLTRAQHVMPYPIEIISGEKEATLIYQGVAHTYPVKGTTLVIDIGGGSTEFIIGKYFKIKFSRSLSMGSRAFSNKFFTDGLVTKKNMRLAQAEVYQVLLPTVQECRFIGWKSVIGTSGSFKVIKEIMLELYGDTAITEKRIQRLITRFIDYTSADNVQFKCFEASRFTLIASALAIISTCMDLFKIKRIDVSNAALREGVLYGLSNIQEKVAPRDRTITALLKLHRIDQVFSRRVLLQLKLFNEQLNEQGKKINETHFMFLHYAALLHEVGMNINTKKFHKHGEYILQNSAMPGFSEQEQLIIATLVGQQRGKIKLNSALFLLTDTKYLQLLQLLRLALILTLGRGEFPPQKANISLSNKQLTLTLPQVLFKNSELFSLLEKEVELQKNVGLTLTLLPVNRRLR
ncbi:exopolyphosphatase [Psychromonas sp. psych-6C06]|uniref:Ppx/GppA phosphatase family protein n=1 Tax=Psychromonas sp. psych-6C06 TaxID=2058089 RepID=UPI000C34AC24|nr:Ppx/GppA phosphatase family protein [Psychromonas sp. psych-6C06]PKF63329.1 exopolyphosphatase [Psychromonas sp. psych-6C06]